MRSTCNLSSIYQAAFKTEHPAVDIGRNTCVRMQARTHAHIIYIYIYRCTCDNRET